MYICTYIFAILFTGSIYQKNKLRDLTRIAMNYEGVGQDSDGMAESDKLCFSKQLNKIIIAACGLNYQYSIKTVDTSCSL